MSESKSVRLRLPGGELLTLHIHPGYIHFKRISPGQKHFVHEVYVPRKSVIPLIRWLARALADVPRSPDHYPPLAARVHYQKIAALEENQRAQKKALYEERRQATQRKRFLAAKRRAKKRRRPS